VNLGLNSLFGEGRGYANGVILGFLRKFGIHKDILTRRDWQKPYSKISEGTN
jgi:hypothetical protein